MAAHTVALAHRLGCIPAEVEKLLAKTVGSRFNAGEEIAKSRKDRWAPSVIAPFSGALSSYNRQSGVGVFMSGA